MLCPECNSENTEEFIFCVSCGARLKEDNSLNEENNSKNFSQNENKKSIRAEEENIKKSVKTNPFAVASLITAIVTPLSCCGRAIPILGYLFLILHIILCFTSIILGIVAKKQISNSNNTQSGSGYAIGGIITGSLFLILFAIYMLLVFMGVIAAIALPEMMQDYQ